MKIKVICGDDACRVEFSADTGDPAWECPQCERVIKNPHYPFLSARVMQSRFRPDEVDWEDMFEKLLTDVHVHFKSKIWLIDDEMHGAVARDGLGEEFVQFVRWSAMGDSALVEKLRSRSNSDYRKMHDTLLEEAQEVAVKLQSIQEKFQDNKGS